MKTNVEYVQSVVTRVAHFTDAKRWSDLRALFASSVDVDSKHTSSDVLLSGWKERLNSATTSHLLGPIDVTFNGANAEAECHVRANHYARGDEWIMDGHYHFGLTRDGDTWRITRMKLDVYKETGNKRLP